MPLTSSVPAPVWSHSHPSNSCVQVNRAPTERERKDAHAADMRARRAAAAAEADAPGRAVRARRASNCVAHGDARALHAPVGALSKAWLPSHAALHSALAVPIASVPSPCPVLISRPVLMQPVDVGHFSEASFLIISVGSGHAKPMLDFIAPGLLERCGSLRAKNGADHHSEVWLSISHQHVSPAHRDFEHGLLVAISGCRTVYLAPPERFADSESRDSSDPDSLLSQRYDPFTSPESHHLWLDPITLKAGDALLIPRLYWHSIGSEKGAIAVGVDVCGDVDGAQVTPKVFMRATFTEPVRGWSSAKRLMRLWQTCCGGA